MSLTTGSTVTIQTALGAGLSAAARLNFRPLLNAVAWLSALAFLVAPFPTSAAPSPIVAHVQGQPGDISMQGQTLTLRTADGYVATQAPAGNQLDFTVAIPGNPSTLHLILRAANDAELIPGFYADATSLYLGATAVPQIGFTGPGPSCGGGSPKPMGDFTILEITRNTDGTVATLAVDFTYHCIPILLPGTFGQLRYNSDVPVDTSRRIVDSFSFPGVANAVPGSVVTSAAIAVSGIDVPVPVSITGGEFSINGGAFTSGGGLITNGQTIAVRQNAASTANTLKVATVNLAGYRVPFRVGTPTGNTPQPTGEPLVVLRGQATSSSPTQTQIYSPANLYQFDLGAGTYFWPSISASLSPANGYAWRASVGGPNNTPITPGTYNSTANSVTQTMPLLATTGPISCDGNPGATMVVHEVEYSPQGYQTKLAADFVQQCNSANYARIFGAIRFNSTVPIDYTQSLPVPFTFPMVSGAALSTYVESNTVTIAGVNVPVAVSIVGGEFSVNGGPFTGAAATVLNGQTLKVRLMSAATTNTLSTATLTTGGLVVPFSVGTRIDALPQPAGGTLFTFISMPRDAGLPNVTQVMSVANGYTFAIQRGSPGIAYLSGVNYASSSAWTAQIAGPGQMQLTPGDYPAGSYLQTGGAPKCNLSSLGRMRVHEVEYLLDGMLSKLALDYVEYCSADVFGYANIFGYLRINSLVPIDYSIRLPAAIVFAPVTRAGLGMAIVSNEVTVHGINVDVPLAIAGGEYSVDGGAFTSAPGTISPGQRLRIRVTSAASPNSLTSAAVTVGELSTTFAVGTAPLPRPQPSGTPMVVLLSQDAGTGLTTETVLSAATMAQVSWSATHADTTEILVRAVREGYGQSWSTTIAGPGNEPLAAGTYTGANFYGDATTARFATDNYFPISCTYNSTAKIVIHEIELSPQGQPTRLALDFQQVCPPPYYGQQPGLTSIYGYVRINSSVPINYTVRRPIQFTFPSIYAVEPGAAVLSSEVTVQGITEAVPLTVSGAEVSLDGGPFSAAATTVIAGQKLKLKVTAPTAGNAVLTATLMAGETTATFTVTTQTGVFPQPTGNALIVLISQGQDPIGGGATYVLSPATGRKFTLNTVWGTDVALNANLVAGTPYFGDWNFNFAAPDRTKLTSATQYSGASRWPFQPAGKPGIDVNAFSHGCGGTGEFYVHEVRYTNDVIDKLAVDFVHYCSAFPLYGYIRINSLVPINQVSDVDPGRIEFATVEHVPRNTQIVSAPLTIASINTSAPISVSGGEYSIDGGAFTSAPGTISLGQVLRLRGLSSNSFQTLATMTVTIGPVTATFATYTEAQDTYADPIIFANVTNAPRNSWVTSQLVMLTGTNATTNATVYGGEMSIGGRAFTSAPQTIEPGETIQLRIMSSPRHSEAYAMGGQVAGQYFSFYVQTMAGLDLTVTVSGNGSVVSQPAGLSCAPVCTQKFDTGSTVTLLATTGAGVGFTGWSGACSGIGACSVTMDAAKNVTASFAITIPGAPAITSAVPGRGLAVISFTSPANNGGSGITAYTATCSPGGITATASASPIVVSGLTNGTSYSCTVSATNAIGTSSPSTAAIVTPENNVPLALVRLESRKTHGNAGTYNLPLKPSAANTGDITIEPRAIGAGHQVVFVFNDSITAIGSVSAIDGNGTAVSATAGSLSGAEVIVTLPDVPNARRVTVLLQGVNGGGNAQVSLGFLLGDVNGSASIDDQDVAALRARSGQMADGDNFHFDINASGRVTAADLLGAKARRGAVLP